MLHNWNLLTTDVSLKALPFKKNQLKCTPGAPSQVKSVLLMVKHYKQGKVQLILTL